MVDWNSIAGISETVALGAVALIGYLIGRTRQPDGLDETVQVRQDAQSAARVAKNLEQITAGMRRELSVHLNRIAAFQTQLTNLVADDTEAQGCDQLRAEAENVLAPTRALASHLSNAYDQIRQQSNQLFGLTGKQLDPVTGVSSLAALQEQLALLLSHRSDSQGAALAIFEIERGGEADWRRDETLIAFTRLLESAVRTNDWIARYGGGEFVVLFPYTGLIGATVCGQRICELAHSQLRVAVSGGVAESEAADDTKSLLSRADSALYSAKAAGRNCVFVHNGRGIRPAPATLVALSEGMPNGGFRKPSAPIASIRQK